MKIKHLLGLLAALALAVVTAPLSAQTTNAPAAPTPAQLAQTFVEVTAAPIYNDPSMADRAAFLTANASAINAAVANITALPPADQKQVAWLALMQANPTLFLSGGNPTYTDPGAICQTYNQDLFLGKCATLAQVTAFATATPPVYSVGVYQALGGRSPRIQGGTAVLNTYMAQFVGKPADLVYFPKWFAAYLPTLSTLPTPPTLQLAAISNESNFVMTLPASPARDAFLKELSIKLSFYDREDQ